jgi:hypothetical protein
MTIRSTILGRSKLFLLLVAAVVADGVASTARASDAAAQNYLQTLTNPDPDITGNVNARVTPAATSVMVSHARAARALFSEARAAMDRGLLVGEAAPAANVAAVDAAMKHLRLHLDILASIAKPRTAAAVKKASGLTQEWYEAGLKVIKPSTDGVLELPAPVAMHAKADAVAAALEIVIEDAVGALKPATPSLTRRHVRAPKRRVQPVAAGPRVGDSPNLADLLGFKRDTHY